MRSRQTDTGPTNVAWAAGYIDGEGCISVSKNGPKQKHMLRLTVLSTNPLPLPKLRYLFGGTISGPRVRNGHRPAWTWSAGSRDTLLALERLLPYLTVKRDEARVALTYPQFGRRGGGRRISSDILEGRQAVAEELKRLKDLTRSDPFATLEPRRSTFRGSGTCLWK